MRAVGSSKPRIDARDKVSGVALYPGDIDRPEQLFLKTLFAERPHARIVSIDTSMAEKAPGVVALFSAADVPNNEYGLIMPDQPVLCGPGAPAGAPDSDVVRFVGDQIALVVAETEAQAVAAAALIEIDWRDLPIVSDPMAAKESGSIQVHASRDSNVLLEYHIRRGDVENAFAGADVIVEATYRTGAQEHAYLQPEAGVSYIDDRGRVVVEAAGQWAHEDQQQIAHALALPLDQVVVRYPAIGGAFGGREDLSVQIVLALAAWRLYQRGIARPVKTIWSRRESIIGHHKRHPMVIEARWGANRDGKLVAQRMDLTSDCGAYAYTSTKVLGNATLACLGPYECANQWVDSRTVYTNNVPGGAFRGFGGPQGHFAAEMQMNKLAEALGMDPVEFRARNVWKEGSVQATRSVLPPGVTMLPVLERCAQEAGWQCMDDGWEREAVVDGPPASSSAATQLRNSLDSSAPGRRLQGVGIAASFKNVGFSLGFRDVCFATVELHGGEQIERVVVRHAGADLGQGAHTVMAQIAAEVVGVPVGRVEMIVSDTSETDNSGSSSASRMTFMAGNAIKGAAEQALARWQNKEDRPCVARYEYLPRRTTPYDPETGESDPNITYGYCAQAAQVEVDPDTGHVRVERIISVNDVGRAINPQQVEGQIEGAVSQSVGWAVQEEFLQEDGRVLTDQLSTYLIPTILDVADVESVILEFPDPQGPFGARGMAEMPFIPTAPAIAAAIHRATGIWFDELPLTPERVWRGLREGSSK
ncbi:MAG: xanthine dehydrogenase family protein molybdopterin-binding subunit [Chloroflexota bacterium]|nr:xanthine dehydrogenase family protein molybdopterin-binding subunit [Chloroflexota bacterium]